MKRNILSLILVGVIAVIYTPIHGMDYEWLRQEENAGIRRNLDKKQIVPEIVIAVTSATPENLKTLNQLIHQKVNINAEVPGTGQTALIRAVRAIPLTDEEDAINTQMIKALLNAHADVSKKDLEGYSALLRAVHINKINTLLTLIIAGANPFEMHTIDMGRGEYVTRDNRPIWMAGLKRFTPLEYAKRDDSWREKSLAIPILENLAPTFDEMENINAGLLSLEKTNPTVFQKDIKSIIRSKIVANIIENKIAKIEKEYAAKEQQIKKNHSKFSQYRETHLDRQLLKQALFAVIDRGFKKPELAIINEPMDTND